MQSFNRNVTGIGVLADQVRREPVPVRVLPRPPRDWDQAAQAVGVARHKAKFHLTGWRRKDCWRPIMSGSPGAPAPVRDARPSATAGAAASSP